MHLSQSSSDKDLIQNSPWQWLPSKAAWFERVLPIIDEYSPHASLGLDAHKVKSILEKLAIDQQDWLYHPVAQIFFNKAAWNDDEIKIKQDINLLIYLSQNSVVDLGSLRISKPTFVWSNQGGIKIEAGNHDLSKLSDKIDSKFRRKILLDVCCHSIDRPHKESWFWRDLNDNKQVQALNEDIQSFGHIISELQNILPHWFDWASNILRIIIPLARYKIPAMSSSTFENGPGYIAMDFFEKPMMLMKILVHETSHLYFHLAQCTGPFVDPQYEGEHWSPLKRTLRPFIKVFIAYHAMAYMAAFLREALSTSIERSSNFKLYFQNFLLELQDTRQVLDENRSHFTKNGIDFLKNTNFVSDFAIS